MADEVIADFTKKTTIVVNDLLPETDYLAEIRAAQEDTGIETVNSVRGPWSPALRFTTITDEVPPLPVENLVGEVLGSSFRVTWTNPYEKEDGRRLQNFKDFMVEIYPAGQPGLKEVIYTESLSLNISIDMNEAMFGSPQSTLVFVVYVRDMVGNVSAPASVTLSIATLTAPTLTGEGSGGGVTLRWSGGAGHFYKHKVFRNNNEIGEVAGASSVYVDTEASRGPHDYFIRTYDHFDRFVQSNTITVIMPGFFEQDIMPPAAPSDLDYSDVVVDGIASVMATLSWTAPTLNEDGTPYDDHEYFDVRYRTSTANPWAYIRVPDDRVDPQQPETFSTHVQFSQGATVYWGVRAVDRYGNDSVWAVSQDQATVDDVVPPKPSQPKVAGNLQTIQVRHDLKDAWGNRLPLNVQRLDIHISDDPNFEPHYPEIIEDSETLVGRASVNRLIRMGSSLVWSTPHEVTDENQEVYVRVVAVTGYPQYSPASDVVGPELIFLVQDIHIEKATITDAKIANLDAGKLIAGSAFIHDLDVKSKLIVGQDGSLESGVLSPDGQSLESTFDFDNQTGWRLDGTGLYMFDGVISAGALNIQDGSNLVDNGYAVFSYGEDWYENNLWFGGTMPQHTGIDTSWARYGAQSLRLEGLDMSVYFSPLTSIRNIRVEGGLSYVYSAYVRNRSATYSVDVRLRILRNTSSSLVLGPWTTVEPGEVRRVYFAYEMPADVTSVNLSLQIFGYGDINIDGVQFERQTSNTPIPSVFRYGGTTTISGGTITTGAIVSNNYVPGVSGWSLPLDGNIEVGNGFFRGSITATSGSLQNLNLSGQLTVTNTGSILRGSATGNGILMDAEGFHMFWNGARRVYFPAGGGDAEFNGKITGGSIQIGSTNFNVNTAGQLYMGGSTFSGSPFRVSASGNLIATGANITGIINATSGSFTGSITATSGDINGQLNVRDLVNVWGTSPAGYIRVGAAASGGSYIRLHPTDGIRSYGTSSGYAFHLSMTGQLTASGVNVGGGTITGATFQTASSGSRVRLTNNPLQFMEMIDSGTTRMRMIWNASTRTFEINSFGTEPTNMLLVADHTKVSAALGELTLEGGSVAVAGRFEYPSRSALRRRTSTQSVTNGSWTNFASNDTSFTAFGWTVSSSGIRPGQPGRYLVVARALCNWSGGSRTAIDVTVGGSTLDIPIRTDTTSSIDVWWIEASGIVEITSSTSTINFRIFHDGTSGSSSIGAGSSLSVVYVGE